MILGTVVMHGLLETIYQMSFQGFFAKKLQLVIAGVLVAACALIFQKDLLHFDSYIPKQEASSFSVGSDGYIWTYTLYYKTQKNTSQHKKHTLSVLSVKVPCPVLFKYDMILSELKRKEVHQYGFRWTCYIQYRI
mgnify:CR=1 FL=1